ncbi:TNF receptor-associated factor 6-like [Orbicella faveolata]|uniref:TNF receptor-associated factor 6-like n=1 Tax=Orbicella faveolata TaxID=48498 RepID=UPI0009E3B85F|nr:TNF receptor-associated factor 6-like [Orbicella faveolata]
MEEEFEGEPRIGGHDVVFVDELSPGQICPVCLLAMRSPVQTVCGHRFCESCLLETFRDRERHGQVCPQDRNPIPDGGFFRDVAWEREILSLRVKCKQNERGCDWTGQLRHYEVACCK